MKNPCGRFTPPGLSGSPLGRGQKTKAKVKSVFGGRGTARKFITGR